MDANSDNYLMLDKTLKNNILNLNDAIKVNFPPIVEKIFEEIAAKEGFIDYKIFRRMIPNNGSSYLGDMYEVDIKGETKDGPHEIYIFLKKLISGAMKFVVDIDKSYSHEVLFYKDLRNMIDMLQDDANVSEGERFKVAKSYECISDAIILENLKSKGFKTLHKMAVMPLEFAELAITQLAKFHGLSFMLKHKQRDYYENKIKTLESPMVFDDIVAWKKLVKKNVELTITHFDKDTQEKISNFLNSVYYDKAPKYMRGDTESVKCMCHGDFRISNVMTKGIGEVNVISEAVIIDYQFLFYGSPVLDLLFFFYTGTDRKFRTVHMDHLKNLYYEKLKDFLEFFEIDINDEYPKKAFKEDFMNSLDYGLMVALYSTHFVFTLEDEVPDFNKESYVDVAFKLDDRYKERITDAVEEYMEWGILH